MERRNADFSRINKGLSLVPHQHVDVDTLPALTTHRFDRVFWFGVRLPDAGCSS